MTVNRSNAQVLGVVIAVVGVVVGARTVLRYIAQDKAAPTNPRSAMRNVEQDLAPATPLPQEAYTFTIKPTEKTAPDVAQEIGERVFALAEALSGEGRLDSYRAGRLREAVARQMSIMLLADYEEWRRRALEYGPPEKVLPEKAAEPDYRELWERCASKMKLAPLSIEHVTVRPLCLNGEMIEYPRAAAMFRAWPSLSARYPQKDPQAYKLDVYEALIPVHYTSAESTKPDTPIHLGVSFWWDEEHGRWTPYDLVGYADALGHTMSAMVF